MGGGARPGRWMDRWAAMLTSRPPVAPYGHDYAANDMRIDEAAVCPRCLRWIKPDEIVRRTAYGPAQHEVCPLSTRFFEAHLR